MAATCTFRMETVDGAAFHGSKGILDEPALVQRIRMDSDLNVFLIGNVQAIIDGGWRGSPVLMQLQADSTGSDLLAKRFRLACIALAEQSHIDRKRFDGLKHAMDSPWPRCNRGC